MWVLRPLGMTCLLNSFYSIKGPVRVTGTGKVVSFYQAQLLSGRLPHFLRYLIEKDQSSWVGVVDNGCSYIGTTVAPPYRRPVSFCRPQSLSPEDFNLTSAHYCIFMFHSGAHPNAADSKSFSNTESSLDDRVPPTPPDLLTPFLRSSPAHSLPANPAEYQDPWLMGVGWRNRSRVPLRGLLHEGT